MIAIDYFVGGKGSLLCKECHHIEPSVTQATIYCLGVSAAFVGSLYLLVPTKVRLLDRDDPRQVQWRSIATGIICLGSIVIYPYCFCHDITNSHYHNSDRTTSMSVLERMGIYTTSTSLYRRGGGTIPIWKSMFGALAHSMVLYTGPLVMILIKARIISQQYYNSSSSSSRGSSPQPPPSYWDALKALAIPSYLSSSSSAMIMTPQNHTTEQQQQRKREIWIALRSQLIAPVMEEIAFRGCMIPPLLATKRFSSSPNTVVWLAPIFFGLAHGHHAILKLQQGETLVRTILVTTFQFLYTTLFGVYAGHAFLRSRSILAVILSHSFCNTMGLPSLSFLNQSSPLYPYRIVLMTAHLIGVAGFAWGFQVEFFLPFMIKNKPS